MSLSIVVSFLCCSSLRLWSFPASHSANHSTTKQTFTVTYLLAFAVTYSPVFAITSLGVLATLTVTYKGSSRHSRSPTRVYLRRSRSPTQVCLRHSRSSTRIAHSRRSPSPIPVMTSRWSCQNRSPHESWRVTSCDSRDRSPRGSRHPRRSLIARFAR